jgi:hypothetical protein
MPAEGRAENRGNGHCLEQFFHFWHHFFCFSFTKLQENSHPARMSPRRILIMNVIIPRQHHSNNSFSAQITIPFAK